MITDRERTAYHEAGHFVASWALELVTYHITIIPNPDTGTGGLVASEACERWVDESQHPPREAIEAHLISLYAGYAAQRHFDPDEPDDRARAAAASDFSAAEVWADQFNLEELLARTQSLIVERWWTEVELIAKALLLKEKLDPYEAEALIDITHNVEVVASAQALIGFHKWSTEEIHGLTGVRLIQE
jgi:hypothetical protein